MVKRLQRARNALAAGTTMLLALQVPTGCTLDQATIEQLIGVLQTANGEFEFEFKLDRGSGGPDHDRHEHDDE